MLVVGGVADFLVLGNVAGVHLEALLEFGVFVGSRGNLRNSSFE